MIYKPDNWVMIKVHHSTPYYKILAGWGENYRIPMWKISSAIVSLEEATTTLHFHTVNGSVYKCSKMFYELRPNVWGVWKEYKDLWGDKVEILPENTKWKSLEYYKEKEKHA